MKRIFFLRNLFNGVATYSMQTNIRCVATETFAEVKRPLKIEKEYKTLKSDILPTLILNRQVATIEEWNDIRNEIFKSGREITAVNIDTLILNFCISKANYGLAYNYFEFLKKENLKPNLATIGKYFKLFYLSNSCNKIMDEEKERNILALYNELRKNYQVLDWLTCDNVIHALSITKEWEECLRLLEEIKISSDPSASAYSVIVAASFKNGKNELGWQLLNEAINEKNRSPLSLSYIAYLQQCEKSVSKSAFLKLIERLLDFLKQNDSKYDDELIKCIEEAYRKFELNSKITRIDARGSCLNCKQKLDKFKLTKQEFEDLKSAIMKNIIIGKNVFYRTTPAELKKFQEFISAMKQYDVVIDGLNVAYSSGLKQSSYVISSLLANVVQHFVHRKKNILVLGRTHMDKWPRKNWDYITQNADTFLAQSLSQDDPYLLYCALNSGQNTIIVTRDLMRSHLFKLKEPRLKILFNQWLMQSQYQIKHVDNHGKVLFKYPPPYIRSPHKHENSWHVPFPDNDDSYEDRWLCLSR